MENFHLEIIRRFFAKSLISPLNLFCRHPFNLGHIIVLN